MSTGNGDARLPMIRAAAQLWTHILQGFEVAGYAKVLPEYQRLSSLLAQERLKEIVNQQAETADWQQLRELGKAALTQLTPLVESARILAELPSSAPVDAVQTQPLPIEPTDTNSNPAAPMEKAPGARSRAAAKKRKPTSAKKATSKRRARKS